MKNLIFDRFPSLKEIPVENFPKHVFIIPDGNGRWSKKHNVFITEGHRKGFKIAEEIIRDLSEILAINTVTLWGFSSDNWKRKEKEISGLMSIFQLVVRKILKEFSKDNRRFIHIGRKDRLPKKLMELIQKAERETEKNSGQILCLALDYSGEDQAIRIIEKARLLSPNENISQETLWKLRDSNGVVKSADLLFRTSGEKRTSDVGWLNGISTELYFTEKYFPDIKTDDIVKAIIDFSKRERRFGGRK